jgi:alpha-glucosidase
VDAPVRQVLLRFLPDGEQRFLPMTREPDTPGCSWWSAVLPLDMPAVNYRFLLLTTVGALWFTARGLTRATPTDAGDFRIVPGPAGGVRAGGPDWLADSVFYQIAPDRFHDGDPSISVRTGEYALRGTATVQRAWGEDPSPSWDTAHVEFFGGDLKGVAEKLPYLLDLGVNALYLLPVFTAPSIHKYDVTDYENVDPHLGGNSGLSALRRATTDHGIRMILDIVPNHCGREHPWFRAAAADVNAPTAEFFTFTNHPNEYASWLGHASLPRLNYASPRLLEYMITGPDAIFKRWLRPPYAIDGWRVDVANMLGRHGGVDRNLELARLIRAAVKSENPEAFLLAEHFFDASSALQWDGWDAAMNYAGFAVPLWSWLTSHGFRQHWEPFAIPAGSALATAALLETWDEFRSRLPWETAVRQLNLLGSHDTPRLLSMLDGHPALQQVAVGLLMTYPGVPCILYGDEIGLEGRDTHVLKCMPWDERAWNLETRSYYRALIRLRRTSSALCAGGYQVLDRGVDWFAYQRDAEDDLIIVIANRGGKAPGDVAVAAGGIPDGTVFRDVMTGKEVRVSAGCVRATGGGPGIILLRARF